MWALIVFSVGSLISVIVGSVVVYQQIDSVRHRLYGVLTIAFLANGLANYMSLNTGNDQLLLMRLVMLTSSAMAYLCFLFIYSLKENRLPRGPFADWAFVSTLLICIMSLTAAVINNYEPGSPPSPVLGWGSPLFIVHIFSMLFMATRILVDVMQRARRKERSRYVIVLIGVLPSMVVAPVTGILLPSVFNVPEYVILTPLYTVFFVVCVGYAIVRHGLLDIRAAVIRSVSYLLVLSSLALVYYLLAYGLSVAVLGGSVSTEMSVSPLNVALALVLALLFQPFKRFFDRVTNGLFYKDSYSAQDFYETLNIVVRSQSSLSQLMLSSSELIQETLKSEYVALIAYRGDGDSFEIAGSGKYKKMPLVDAHMFDSLRKPVHVDDDIEPSLRRVMVSHRAVIAVPLYIDSAFIGLMYLGARLTSKFNKRDIRTLTVAAGELVVGIQNALAVQEIRDLNENLQHKIDAATKELRRSNAQLQKLDEVKDEFMSMASHQLRTPLTSIKGYLSMLIDGDMGPVTKQQEHVLKEAFASSERMVRLIADFLNVSRLQTGKFVIDKKPLDLAKLVESEVSALKHNAASRDLTFKYTKPKDLPLIDLDENKIQQVIMNFCDNAIYYSKDNSTITVSLKRVGNSAEFTVKDTGIGVPESEQAGLFTKFFRATNARQQRPDGTGVGLFLAQKVIKGHGGKVIFSSKEGKGSTFGFSLPLPKK